MNNEIVPEEINMVIGQMMEILEGVDRLADVTSEHIERIKLLGDGPIIINKFQTSLEEFDHWSSRAGNGIKDVGLVAGYFVVRYRYAWILECLQDFINTEQVGQLKNSLNSLTLLSHSFKVRSKSSFPYGGTDTPQHELDRILSETYSLRAPFVALEFAISDTPSLLQQSSTHVLTGIDNVTKVITMLNFIPQSAQNTSDEDDWGLCESEIQEMEHHELCMHAYNWYHERGIWLTEDFHMTVHSWEGTRYHEFPESFDFHFTDWIAPDTVEDIIRTVPSPFSANGETVSITLAFPLRQLVALLQQKRMQVEYDRVALCVAKKQGRRRS